MTININNIWWKVIFVDRKDIEGNDGQTRPNDLTILIANDLSYSGKIVCFRHELTHAILDTQGRCYQRKFDLEEVCEFVAWTYEIIQQAFMTFLEEIKERN